MTIFRILFSGKLADRLAQTQRHWKKSVMIHAIVFVIVSKKAGVSVSYRLQWAFSG
jgi:hypothetical protein